MNEHYLISVIVPVYNVEKYLRKCIESIINQQYTNLQIILIDDGSTDKSGKICDEYALFDRRIEVSHKSNGGLVSARKTGLLMARGEYIGFVDGDDYIETDFYQDLLDDIVENDADFVHSNFIMEYNRPETADCLYETGNYELTGKQVEFIKTYILKSDSKLHMNHNIFSKLFKNSIIKKSYMVVPDFQSRGEDLLGVCNCILNSKKIFLDTKASYHYVMRNDSITHCNSIESIIDLASLYKCLLNLFEDNGILEKIRKELGEYFDNFFVEFLSLSLGKKQISLYEFPDIKELKGKKVILYCAGKVGQDYYAQMCKYDEIKVIAWADKNYMNFCYDYKEIISKDDIANYEFDVLVVAIAREAEAKFIKSELIEAGIPEEKIIWKEPVRIKNDK